VASPSLLQARLRVPRGIIRAASGLGPAFFDGIDKFTPTGAAQPVKPDGSKVNTIHRNMTLSLFESVVQVGRAVVTALVEYGRCVTLRV
jgi:hypothetical protein